MVTCFQGSKAVMQWQLLFSKISHCYNFTDLEETKTFTLVHTGLLNVAIYFWLWDQVSFDVPYSGQYWKHNRGTSWWVYLKGGSDFFALSLPFQQRGNKSISCRASPNCIHIAWQKCAPLYGSWVVWPALAAREASWKTKDTKESTSTYGQLWTGISPQKKSLSPSSCSCSQLWYFLTKMLKKQYWH